MDEGITLEAYRYGGGLGFRATEKWHKDPDYRLKCYEIMSEKIRQRFPGRNIGGVNDEGPPDLFTGVDGGAGDIVG